MKVLISDKIPEKSLDLFDRTGIKPEYSPEISKEELFAVIPEFDALIVRSRTKVTSEVIARGKILKVIGRVGSGVDNIDTDSAKNNKIIVVNAPDANTQAVAEHTLGLMLSLLRKYRRAFLSMDEGLWLKKDLSGSEISGKTVGIVGYGHIGQKVEYILKAFGARCLIYSRRKRTAELGEIFSSSDIVTVHVPLSPETKNLISGRYLQMMKKSSVIINTSRGGIISDDELFECLKSGKIAGAALDVFPSEPLPPDSPFRKLENCILTPHIGASTKEAGVRGSLTVIKDVVNVLKGGIPENPVIK